jgi:hypothetical protein
MVRHRKNSSEMLTDILSLYVGTHHGRAAATKRSSQTVWPRSSVGSFRAGSAAARVVRPAYRVHARSSGRRSQRRVARWTWRSVGDTGHLRNRVSLEQDCGDRTIVVHDTGFSAWEPTATLYLKLGSTDRSMTSLTSYAVRVWLFPLGATADALYAVVHNNRDFRWVEQYGSDWARVGALSLMPISEQ